MPRSYDFKLISSYANPDRTDFGDVNGNGEVQTLDAAWITQYIEGTREFTETQKLSADANLDGKINAADTSLINSYVLETIPELPVASSTSQTPATTYSFDPVFCDMFITATYSPQ